jgi:primary-amine oxidase
MHGTAIQWGRWRLRAAVDPRRGLELYDVGFLDQGRVRSILYRASISEMIAPYGGPAFGSWYPMDEGDVGLGAYGMTSAVPGEDAPETPTHSGSQRGTRCCPANRSAPILRRPQVHATERASLAMSSG